MLTITTTDHLHTERERIERVKENKHLIDLTDSVKLECSSGDFTYNTITDLFGIGEQYSYRVDSTTYEVVRLTQDEYEIHDTSDEWVSAVVDLKTLQDVVSKEIDINNLNWK